MRVENRVSVRTKGRQAGRRDDKIPELLARGNQPARLNAERRRAGRARRKSHGHRGHSGNVPPCTAREVV